MTSVRELSSNSSFLDFMYRQSSKATSPFLPWLVRRVEVVRGQMPIRMECAPAFNYSRTAHTTKLVPDDTTAPSLERQLKVIFSSPADPTTSYDGLSLDLRYVVETAEEQGTDGCHVPLPKVEINIVDLGERGHLGPAVTAEATLVRHLYPWSLIRISADSTLQLEGQIITWVLRTPPHADIEGLTPNQEVDGRQVGVPTAVVPSTAKAHKLGVPLDRLTLASNKLRAPEDPILTYVWLRNSPLTCFLF
jgi:hypothetical protein